MSVRARAACGGSTERDGRPPGRILFGRPVNANMNPKHKERKMARGTRRQGSWSTALRA